MIMLGSLQMQTRQQFHNRKCCKFSSKFNESSKYTYIFSRIITNI